MSDSTASIEETTNNELKAGHAPALKVGGMRVSAPRRTSRSDETNNGAASTDNDKGNQDADATNQADASEQNQETTTTVAQHQPSGQLVGGQFVKIQDAFPTEAVRHTYDKKFDNVPKNEHHTRTNHHEAKFIIQPRKM